MKKETLGGHIFDIFNYTFLIFLALTCVLPFIHVISISLSSSEATTAGIVGIWPVDFTLNSYEYAIRNADFIRAFENSMARVVLGVGINMALLVLTAYPLSKTNVEFPGRTIFAWFFVVTMLVSSGLIPRYLVVSATGIRNTLWALILPSAVNVFSMTILLNFFRQLPKELEESALMDGAGQWRILARIYIPLSVPALATLFIFSTVGHWNEWFSAVIYMNSTRQYPLQTYLRSIIVNTDVDLLDPAQMEILQKISRRNFVAAQIMIGAMPILCIYPFMQKYFVKGITLGSIKG